MTKKYPGVKFDKSTKKYIATHRSNGVVYVSTNNTFEQAKTAKIQLEKRHNA